MNKHKIVIEMVVGQALPSASVLREVLDEVNRDIRMDFARNDWYAEITSVQIEKVAKQENTVANPLVEDTSKELRIEGLSKEQFSAEMRRLMESLVSGFNNSTYIRGLNEELEIGSVTHD